MEGCTLLTLHFSDIDSLALSSTFNDSGDDVGAILRIPLLYFKGSWLAISGTSVTLVSLGI